MALEREPPPGREAAASVDVICEAANDKPEITQNRAAQQDRLAALTQYLTLDAMREAAECGAYACAGIAAAAVREDEDLLKASLRQFFAIADALQDLVVNEAAELETA